MEIVTGDGWEVDEVQQETPDWTGAGASVAVPAGSGWQAYDPKVHATEVAQKHGFDPDVFHNLIRTESVWNPKALGPVTKYGQAKGLTQMIPATAKSMGVTDPYDPEQSIEGGGKYFKQQLDRFGGNYEKALVAYNWGPENAKNWNGDRSKLPKETQGYLFKILGPEPGVGEYTPGKKSKYFTGAGVEQTPQNLGNYMQIDQFSDQGFIPGVIGSINAAANTPTPWPGWNDKERLKSAGAISNMASTGWAKAMWKLNPVVWGYGGTKLFTDEITRALKESTLSPEEQIARHDIDSPQYVPTQDPVVENLRGFAGFTGRPIGLYGLEAAKESWKNEPVDSLIATLGMLLGGRAARKRAPKTGEYTQKEQLDLAKSEAELNAEETAHLYDREKFAKEQGVTAEDVGWTDATGAEIIKPEIIRPVEEVSGQVGSVVREARTGKEKPFDVEKETLEGVPEARKRSTQYEPIPGYDAPYASNEIAGEVAGRLPGEVPIVEGSPEQTSSMAAIAAARSERRNQAAEIFEKTIHESAGRAEAAVDAAKRKFDLEYTVVKEGDFWHLERGRKRWTGDIEGARAPNLVDAYEYMKEKAAEVIEKTTDLPKSDALQAVSEASENISVPSKTPSDFTGSKKIVTEGRTIIEAMQNGAVIEKNADKTGWVVDGKKISEHTLTALLKQRGGKDGVIEWIPATGRYELTESWRTDKTVTTADQWTKPVEQPIETFTNQLDALNRARELGAEKRTSFRPQKVNGQWGLYPGEFELDNNTETRLSILRDILNNETGIAPILNDVVKAIDKQSRMWASKMREVFAKDLPDRFTAAEFDKLANIYMQKGKFKAEEWADTIRMTNLNAWLGGKEGQKISKQEILDWMDLEGIRVEEVTRGALFSNPEYMRYDKQITSLYDKKLDLYDKLESATTPTEIHNIRTELRAIDAERQLLSDEQQKLVNSLDPPKYEGGSQVLPDGKEYIELVLTSPQAEKLPSDPSHFVEGKGERQIGWIRGQVFTDAQGRKIFNIEEVQSKRHSGANKRRELEVKRVSEEEGISKEEAEKKVSKDFGYKEVFDEVGKKYVSVDSPFRKTWPTLLLKRALKYVAENGYDGVSWTTGEQQIERTGRPLTRIEYIKEQPNGMISVRIRGEGREDLIQKNLPGNSPEAAELKGLLGERVDQLKEGIDLTSAPLEIGGKFFKKLYGSMKMSKNPRAEELAALKKEARSLYRESDDISIRIGEMEEPGGNQNVRQIGINNLLRTRNAVQERAFKISNRIEELSKYDSEPKWTGGILSRAMRDATNGMKVREEMVRAPSEMRMTLATNEPRRDSFSVQPGIIFTPEMKGTLVENPMYMYTFPGPLGEMGKQLVKAWKELVEARKDPLKYFWSLRTGATDALAKKNWYAGPTDPRTKIYTDGYDREVRRFTNETAAIQEAQNWTSDIIRLLPAQDRVKFHDIKERTGDPNYKLSPAGQKIYGQVADIMDYYKGAFQKYGRLREFMEEYFPHIVYEDPTGKKLDIARFLKGREDPLRTLSELQKEGYKVETDVAVWFPTYLMQAEKTLARLEFLRDTKLSLAEDGLPVIRPSKLVTAEQKASALFKRFDYSGQMRGWDSEVSYDNPLVNAEMKKLFEGDMWVHRDIFATLDGMFYDPMDASMNFVQHGRSLVKRIRMYNPLFHGWNIATQDIGALGFDSLKLLPWFKPDILKTEAGVREVMQRFIGSGGNLEGLYDIRRRLGGDQYKGVLELEPFKPRDLIDDPMKALTHPIKSIGDLSNYVLFDKMLKTSQLIVFLTKYDRYMNPSWLAENLGRVESLSPEQAGHLAAVDANNILGTLQPYTFTRKQRAILNDVLFARNWNVGTAKQVTGAMPWAKEVGEAIVPKFLRTEGIDPKQWKALSWENRTYMTRIVVGAIVSANMMQGILQTANGVPVNDVTTTFQNAENHKLDIDTGAKDPSGNPIFLRNMLFRQVEDAYRGWNKGFMKMFMGKVEPIGKAGAETAMNVDYRGRPVYGEEAGLGGTDSQLTNLKENSLAVVKHLARILPYDDIVGKDNRIQTWKERLAPLVGTTVRYGTQASAQLENEALAFHTWLGRSQRLSREALKDLELLKQQGKTDEMTEKLMGYVANRTINGKQFTHMLKDMQAPFYQKVMKHPAFKNYLMSLPEGRAEKVMRNISTEFENLNRKKQTGVSGEVKDYQ